MSGLENLDLGRYDTCITCSCYSFNVYMYIYTFVSENNCVLLFFWLAAIKCQMLLVVIFSGLFRSVKYKLFARFCYRLYCDDQSCHHYLSLQFKILDLSYIYL